jgi:hypothetical protein
MGGGGGGGAGGDKGTVAYSCRWGHPQACVGGGVSQHGQQLPHTRCSPRPVLSDPSAPPTLAPKLPMPGPPGPRRPLPKLRVALALGPPHIRNRTRFLTKTVEE